MRALMLVNPDYINEGYERVGVQDPGFGNPRVPEVLPLPCPDLHPHGCPNAHVRTTVGQGVGEQETTKKNITGSLRMNEFLFLQCIPQR